MKFAKESLIFVLPFALLAVVLAVLGFYGPAIAAAVVGFAVLLFFRNPPRHYDGPMTVLTAPGEGVITSVEEIEDPEIGPGRYHRIVTFLSVFNVHVQRAPCPGRVVVSKASSGRKRAAFHSGIDRVNARHLCVFERPGGDRIGVRQIVGLVARRVVCYLDEGRQVDRGELMGVILFGSRVDLLVPASYRVLVKKGDKVRNGATPLAEAPEP